MTKEQEPNMTTMRISKNTRDTLKELRFDLRIETIEGAIIKLINYWEKNNMIGGQ